LHDSLSCLDENKIAAAFSGIASVCSSCPKGEGFALDMFKGQLRGVLIKNLILVLLELDDS